MNLDVFGRRLEIVRRNRKWLTFYPGSDGKKRQAHDIQLPDDLPETELIEYIADLCHEWASAANKSVTRIS